jgi:hypothetical protein
MSEQAQVGDQVRVTITRTHVGLVYRGSDESGLYVGAWSVYGDGHTVEILSRATPPLPSEPGTWWLDKDENMWQVTRGAVLVCAADYGFMPERYAPFRQLVLK